MIDSKTRDILDAIGEVLLRSALLGFLLIMLWFVLYRLAPGPMYAQAEWFGLAPHEIDIIHYCGMAFVKMSVLVFFLFPYVALRLVLRRAAR